MTVMIPQYYDNTDLFSSGGVALGMKIKPAALQTLANNNNFMWGRFTGPLGHAVFGDAPRGKWTVDGFGVPTYAQGDFEDLALFLVPGDPGQRQFTVNIWCEHTGGAGTDDGTIRIQIDGATAGTITIPKTTSGTSYAVTVDNPGTGNQAFMIQVDSYYVKTYGISVTRARYDNTTLSDPLQVAARETPFHFMQTTNMSSTEPLTDEWVNRGLNNPAQIVSAQRHTLACLSMPIKNETIINAGGDYYEQNAVYPYTESAGKDSDDNQAPAAVIPLTVRYPQTVTILSCLRGEVGVSIRLELSANVTVSGIDPDFSGAPTTGATYPMTATTVALTAGVYQAYVYLDSSTGTGKSGRIYALSIVGGV